VNRGVAAGLATACVVANFAAYAILRDHMATARSPEPARTPPASGQASEEPSAEVIEGPVFLKGRLDGSVLRLTHGDCGTADDPENDPRVLPRAWISKPDTAPVPVEIPGLTQALGVGATPAGWWVVGTDEACEVAAWAAPDGTAWSPAEVPPKAWYVDPVNLEVVHRPGGDTVEVGADCLAESVQPGPTSVYVVCTDDRLILGPLDTDRIEAGAGTGVTTAAVRADGTLATIYNVPPCSTRLEVRDDEGEVVEEAEHCFENDGAPLGITWIGEDLAVQIGYELLDNTSGGWAPRS
jgi:hypothetical protein